MRVSVLLENQHLYVARYDAAAETGPELVTFDGRENLQMRFRVDEGKARIVDCKDEANIRLQARDNMMPLEIAGLTGHTDPSVSTADLADLLFERVAETVGDMSTVVFVGPASPVFKNAAVRGGLAGHIEFEYIDRADAALREWQWVAPEAADDATDVVVLGFGKDGSLTWDFRVATEDGFFIIRAATDAGISNSGSFFPAATDAGLHIGLEKFFTWCQRHGGSRHLLLSGPGGTTLESEAADLISGLRFHYDVSCVSALKGGARPPVPSKHARFDRAVAKAMSATYGLDFQMAIETYEVAKNVFRDENPPEDLDRLRLQIRSELFKSGSVSVASPEAADALFEKALSLSSGNQEIAEGHAQRSVFYVKSGNIRRAEDEALAAFFMDPDTYSDILSKTASDAESHPKLRQLTNLTARAKSEWRARADGQKTVVDTFLKRCNQGGIDIAAPEVLKLRGVKSYTSGILHRINKPLQVIIVGPTNSGKDFLTILCFDKAAASELGEIQMPDGSVLPVLEDEDAPDKTKAVTRVVFGDGDGGLVLFNTPGLYSDTAILPSDDEPVLSDMTRVLVGLEPEVDEISEIAFIDSECSPAKYQMLPLKNVPVNLETDLVIYLVNLAVMPLGRNSAEMYKRDISQLRQSFGDRLIVVGSFLDALQEWSPEKQEERREIWRWVVNEKQHEKEKMVEYSGLTGEGQLNVIHELLRASGNDPSYLMPFLKTELKSSRLSYSFFSLAALLASICDVDERHPYTDLIAGVTITCAAHLSAHYSVTEQEWAAKDADISRIVADGMKKQTVTQERDPKGWFQRFRRRWLGKSYYESVTDYTIGIQGLAEVCSLMYSLIHEFEGVSSPIISESEAESFFLAELSDCGVASALLEKETESVQRSISDVMLKFWRRHHPEALDLKNRLGL